MRSTRAAGVHGAARERGALGGCTRLTVWAPAPCPPHRPPYTEEQQQELTAYGDEAARLPSSLDDMSLG